MLGYLIIFEQDAELPAANTLRHMLRKAIAFSDSIEYQNICWERSSRGSVFAVSFDPLSVSPSTDAWQRITSFARFLEKIMRLAFLTRGVSIFAGRFNVGTNPMTYMHRLRCTPEPWISRATIREHCKSIGASNPKDMSARWMGELQNRACVRFRHDPCGTVRFGLNCYGCEERGALDDFSFSLPDLQLAIRHEWPIDQGTNRGGLRKRTQANLQQLAEVLAE